MKKLKFQNSGLLSARSRSLSAVLVFLFAVACQSSFAQPSIEKLISTLAIGPVPGDLLSTKTLALYEPTFTSKELEQIQNGFERTGVDAVLYCPIDLPFCSNDVQRVFTDYLVKREIKYLAILQKRQTGLEFVFTEFDKTVAMAKPGQSGWKISGKNIAELSMDIYRTAANSQKRVNMLAAPLPEYELRLPFIRGTRGEYFTLDLKIDKLAIVKFGDEQKDRALEEIFKTHYPFKYQFFEPGTEDKDIRQKGFLLTLCFIHMRGFPAMELLEYNMAKSGSAIASITYPNGQMQLKTFPAEQAIYKFYFKQLENGNIYLGTKWDADPDWQQALINQIKGLKTEMGIK